MPAAGAVAQSTPVADPVVRRSHPAGITVTLREHATVPATQSTAPRARINHLQTVPDGSGRQAVPDLYGRLFTIAGGRTTTYLDLAARSPRFVHRPGYGSGFGFVAFHPQFADNGRFYTVHTESGSGLPAPDLPSPADPAVHGVVTEWTATSPSAATFSGSSREVLRLGFGTTLHGIQQIGFDPTTRPGDADHGLLYLGVGDGERSGAWTSAPRDLGQPRGKLLRIDPAGRDAASGRYGIPPSNPHVGQAGALGEVYARGLRNPHRFTFDPADGRLLLANIGEKEVESVYDVHPGDDFGWNDREGSYLFRHDDPLNVYPLPAGDDGITYPVLELHNDTDASSIVGGTVYRGRAVPELAGHYVYGDIVSGRLFATDVADLQRGQPPARAQELALRDASGRSVTMRDLAGADRADIRLGQDADGELYVLSKANGRIWRVTGAERTAPCGPVDASVTNVTEPGDWAPVTPSRWRFSAGEAVLAQKGTEPSGPRRPFEIAHVTTGPAFRSVMVDAQVRLDTPVTGRGEDVVVVFGYQSPTRYYYVHLSDDASSAVHNGIFVVADTDRRRIDHQWDGTAGAPPALPDNAWHEVRVVHCADTGRIAVHLDGSRTPLMTAQDGTLDHGRVGFGSFDNVGRIRGLVATGEHRTVGTPLTCPPGSGTGFRDVASTSVHAASIRCASDLGLVFGTGGDRFDGGGSLTRAQAATIIDRVARATGRPVTAPARSFRDVTAGGTHADAIGRLAGAGIIGGYPDGTFRPNRPITRAQLANLLVGLLEDTAGSTLPRGDGFVDVAAGSTHDRALRQARWADIVQGDLAGRARPNVEVRRDQAASIFVRSLHHLPVP